MRVRRIAEGAVVFCAYMAGLRAEERPFQAALIQAIHESDVAAVEKALVRGADVNKPGQSGATPLMEAAIWSNTACMRLQLNHGADVNAANQAGATALMWSGGDLEKVRLLLDKGAVIDAQAKSGRTALTVAASIAGNVETVKLMMARGANVKLKGAVAVSAAAGCGDEAILRLVLAAGGDP